MDKLKITNNTKSKVAEYIKKYMSRFGEVYKRKPSGMYIVLFYAVYFIIKQSILIYYLFNGLFLNYLRLQSS